MFEVSAEIDVKPKAGILLLCVLPGYLLRVLFEVMIKVNNGLIFKNGEAHTSTS